MRAMRGPNPPRSPPGNFLALCQHPGPSIEKGATQMARNLTSPGIELGRALCWGRVSGAHFLYKDKAACRSFYVLFYPRTCVDRFSSQANKSTLIASAISPGNVAIAAIFAHTKEAIHTIASFKKKHLRLSDRCRLKSRPSVGAGCQVRISCTKIRRRVALSTYYSTRAHASTDFQVKQTKAL